MIEFLRTISRYADAPLKLNIRGKIQSFLTDILKHKNFVNKRIILNTINPFNNVILFSWYNFRCSAVLINDNILSVESCPRLAIYQSSSSLHPPLLLLYGSDRSSIECWCFVLTFKVSKGIQTILINADYDTHMK